jgi:hypothetical protein
MTKKIENYEKIILLFGHKLSDAFDESLKIPLENQKQKAYRHLGKILYREFLLTKSR